MACRAMRQAPPGHAPFANTNLIIICDLDKKRFHANQVGVNDQRSQFTLEHNSIFMFDFQLLSLNT